MERAPSTGVSVAAADEPAGPVSPEGLLRPEGLVRDDCDASGLPGAADTLGTGDSSGTGRGRAGLFIALLLLVLSIPLVVALVGLRAPNWFPLLDMAQTELRVRDVWSSHPPLIGLAGRIGEYGPDGGSHPGPLSFFALWPIYQLFGAHSWGLQVAAVGLNVIAMGFALWIAYRRGGVPLLLAIAAALALLTRGYGAALLTTAWNPYMPALWWFLFLLAVWSLLLDDLPMLPVAVFAGIFCVQTHISYLGLIGGMSVLAAVAIVRSARRERGNARHRRDLRRWGLVAAVIAIVTWIPPIIDEIAHDPGNLSTIWEHFSDPPETPVGIGSGVRVLLTQLNPATLLTETLVGDYQPHGIEGSTVPGVLLLAAWVAAAFVAWRLRHRVLIALHIVLGCALVLGAVSTARIFGYLWYYLLLWAWSLTVLLPLAIGWTAIAYFGREVSPRRHATAVRAGAVAVGAIIVVTTVVFSFAGAGIHVQDPNQYKTLGELVGPTADALKRREGDGEKGRYLLSFFPDAIGIGAQGYGLLNELDRRGFDVRVEIINRPGATRSRIVEPREADAEIHLATGADIVRWQQDPRFEQIAYYDPRDDAERAESERLRTELIDDLARARLSDRVDVVDENLFMLGLDEDVPSRTRDTVDDMLALGVPAAVFIGPPSAGL